MRLIVSSFFILTVVIVIWFCMLYTWHETDTVWNYLSNAVWAFAHIGAGVTALIGTRMKGIPLAIRRFFLWSSIGFFLYAIAQMIWTYYNIFLDVEAPTGFIADWFYLSLYIFLAGGVFWLLTFYTPMLSYRMKWETILIIILSFSIMLGVVIRPIIDNPKSFAAAFVGVAYPVGDSIITSLFFLLVRLVGGKMRSGILILMIGLACLAMGDTMYIIRVRHDAYWNGDISDELLAVAAVCFWGSMIMTIKNFSSSSSSLSS